MINIKNHYAKEVDYDNDEDVDSGCVDGGVVDEDELILHHIIMTFNVQLSP